MEISNNDLFDISSSDLLDISSNELAPESSGELDLSGNSLFAIYDSTSDYSELITSTQQLNDNVVVLHNDLNLILGVILIYIFYLFAKHIIYLLMGRKS